MQLESIKRLALEQGWGYESSAPLAAHTTFKIGGAADLFITLPDSAAAARLLAGCRESGVPALLLGSGSNMLIGDGGVRGVVWRFNAQHAACRLTSDTDVFCDAGMPLIQLCRFAAQNGLSGLEFAYGIPGTVGGAVFMNAGAYGGEMAAVLKTVTVLSADGLQEIPAKEMQFGYRHSVLMETGETVVGCTLHLCPKDPEAIAETMQTLLMRRREKQPLNLPSAGSFFKRPPGAYAGALIEACGLKGFAIGGAAVSDKHAGFVVNIGGATAADVRRLAETVIERVYAQTGIRLEPEVRFVGEF